MTVLLFAVAFAAEPPASVTTPIAATDLVAARQISLKEAWTTTWSATQRDITEGTLIVLKVDPELARPKQTWSPVLYAGDTIVEVLARNPESTCLVGLVPSTDLDRRALYWGPQHLPEQVTPEMAAIASAEAAQVGAVALGASARAAVEASPTLRIRALSPDHSALTDLLARCQ